MSQKKISALEQEILGVIINKQPQSTQELLELLKNQGISEKKALKEIEKLHNEGSLKLESDSVSPKPSTVRFRSLPWYASTISCSLIAAILIFVIPPDLYPLAYFRNIFGIAFVLFLPGFALIKTIFWKSKFSRTASKSLENIERVALSFGLSIGVVCILGLFLYYSGFGFHFEIIVITLLMFTGSFATLALILENKTRRTANKSQFTHT